MTGTLQLPLLVREAFIKKKTTKHRENSIYQGVGGNFPYGIMKDFNCIECHFESINKIMKVFYIFFWGGELSHIWKIPYVSSIFFLKASLSHQMSLAVVHSFSYYFSSCLFQIFAVEKYTESHNMQCCSACSDTSTRSPLITASLTASS